MKVTRRRYARVLAKARTKARKDGVDIVQAQLAQHGPEGDLARAILEKRNPIDALIRLLNKATCEPESEEGRVKRDVAAQQALDAFRRTVRKALTKRNRQFLREVVKSAGLTKAEAKRFRADLRGCE